MPHLYKLLIAVMSLASAQHAFSDSLYQFSSVNQTFTDDPVTLGFVFEVNSPFEITSLGWFSPTAEGFQTDHTVGLYDSTGSLLTSADLAAGSANPLTGFF